MTQPRRWRHVMLPVDQLVPVPVVGEQQVVVVSELHARADRIHSITPGHWLIVASSGSTSHAELRERTRRRKARHARMSPQKMLQRTQSAVAESEYEVRPHLSCRRG